MTSESSNHLKMVQQIPLRLKSLGIYIQLAAGLLDGPQNFWPRIAKSLWEDVTTTRGIACWRAPVAVIHVVRGLGLRYPAPTDLFEHAIFYAANANRCIGIIFRLCLALFQNLLQAPRFCLLNAQRFGKRSHCSFAHWLLRLTLAPL